MTLRVKVSGRAASQTTRLLNGGRKIARLRLAPFGQILVKPWFYLLNSPESEPSMKALERLEFAACWLAAFGTSSITAQGRTLSKYLQSGTLAAASNLPCS